MKTYGILQHSQRCVDSLAGRGLLGACWLQLGLSWHIGHGRQAFSNFWCPPNRKAANFLRKTLREDGQHFMLVAPSTQMLHPLTSGKDTLGIS